VLSKGSANNTEIQASAVQTAACRNYISDPLEFSFELAPSSEGRKEMSSDLVKFEHKVQFSEHYGMDFVLIAKGHTMSGIAQHLTAGELRKIRSCKLPRTLSLCKCALITVSEKYLYHNFVASKAAYFFC
jgi:hypothetical protein